MRLILLVLVTVLTGSAFAGDQFNNVPEYIVSKTIIGGRTAEAALKDCSSEIAEKKQFLEFRGFLILKVSECTVVGSLPSAALGSIQFMNVK